MGEAARNIEQQSRLAIIAPLNVDAGCWYRGQCFKVHDLSLLKSAGPAEP
jgi:hypothetical protein